MTEHFECGCPNALRRRNSTSPFLPPVNSDHETDSSSNTRRPDDGLGLTRPPAAHIHNDPNSGLVRPIHLLRTPSFNPPAFSDDIPPPPLMTPPPEYDSVVNGDPRGGLADYFSRLADAIADEEEHEVARSRMELPLTPGGRVNRSMEERRSWRSSDFSTAA